MPRDSLNDGDARARVTQLPEDAGAARQNFTSPAHALARGVRARARKKRPLELKARARDAQRLLEASVRAAVIESARGVFYFSSRHFSSLSLSPLREPFFPPPKQTFKLEMHASVGTRRR